MTKPLILILSLLMALPSSLLALVRTTEEQQEHLNQIIELNAQADNLPKEERIRRLGHALWQLNQPSIFYHHEEVMHSLYTETQQKLLNTPGHAQFYRDRMLEAKAKAFKNGQPRTEPEYSNYLKERDSSLYTLVLLPSVETMEVLMPFLDDNDRPSGKPADFGYFSPLSLQVIPILEQLLEDPAPRGTSWLDWREEVRRGQRTFRFKGSDIRYNFDGPVPDKEIRPDKPLPSDSAAGHSGDLANKASSGKQNNSSTTQPYILLAAFLLLISLAIWAHTKRKP